MHRTDIDDRAAAGGPHAGHHRAGQQEGGTHIDGVGALEKLRRAALDVAEAVVFMAETGFASGTELRVDGGFLSGLRLLPQG
jgi:hypothetical protein